MFRSGAEVEKACAIQSWRRKAASALEKVTAGLVYHAARLGRTRPRAARSLAQSVTSENKASRHGWCGRWRGPKPDYTWSLAEPG